jgi:hypothetical protein
MAMSKLPPLNHPAWLMVAVIACMGAALTTWLARAAGTSLCLMTSAVVFALALAAKVNHHRRS